MSETTKTTEWIDVNEIQEKYLPISKKAIRRVLKENLDVARTGKKILCFIRITNVTIKESINRKSLRKPNEVFCKIQNLNY